jgi:arylsulfatase A-like enzyme
VGNKGDQKVRRANITPADRMVADYLKQVGYHTGLMGKWHLDGYDPGATPTDHGFDEFRGWLVQKGKSQGYWPTEYYHEKELIHIHENDNGRQGRYQIELALKTPAISSAEMQPGLFFTWRTPTRIVLIFLLR